MQTTRAALPTFATLRAFRCAVLALGLLGGAGPAAAQIVDPSFITTDGYVFSMLERGDTLYLGGYFNWVGERRNGLLALDPETGADLHGVPPSGSSRVVTNACIADGQGGWFVGGAFTELAGVPRLNVAHMRGDGSLDAWTPQVDGRVYAMARVEQTLYIGGEFTHVDGLSRSRLAAFDVTTGQLLPWNPGANSLVWVLAASATSVYAGGNFTVAGGAARSRLAALDPASGTALPWAAGADYTVYCLAIYDSTLYVGGGFNQLGGVARKGFAAVRAATGEVLAWGPTPSGGTVQAMAIQDSTLYVGGSFALNLSGQPRNGIAAFNARSGVLTSWAPPIWVGSQNTVTAITTTPERIHIGGMLAFPGHDGERLLALDPQTGQPTAWKCVELGTPTALAVSGGRLLVCGDLQAIAWAERENLAAVDLRQRQVTDWAPRTNDSVRQLLRHGETIYAAGDFTEVEGQPRSALAAFHAESGALLPWHPLVTTNSATIRIATDGAQLFVGSHFHTLGGLPRSSLGAVDLTTGVTTSWDPSMAPAVSGAVTAVTALEVRDSTLYVGGDFAWLGGAPRAFVGAVHTRTALATPWNPTASYIVTDISPTDDFVYVGGLFGTIGGQPRAGMAQLDPITGQPTAWNPCYLGSVYLVVPSPAGVYISGYFELNGPSRRGIALLNPVSGLATDWDPEMISSNGEYATSLALRDSSVIVGGGFSYLGRRPLQGLGRVLPRDLQCPFVTTLGPASGGSLMTGTDQNLLWTAGDNQALLSLDLFVSRSGPAGPWEPIAAGVANTGTYRWRVTGPASGDCHVRIVARDLWGNTATATSPEAFSIELDPTTDAPVASPNRTSLAVRSPIRSAGGIELAFELPARADVSLHVFDLAGRVVARLSEESYEPGRHMRRLPSQNLPPGIYLVRLRAAGVERTRRCVVLR